MKALVFEAVGEARAVLALRNVPAPVPARGQVLVAVESSPVHPADFSFVRGAYRVQPTFPQVAGLSGAGRVVAAGKGVAHALGSRVAFRWPGAWAEQVSVPSERVFDVPDDIAVDPSRAVRTEPNHRVGLTRAG